MLKEIEAQLGQKVEGNLKNTIEKSIEYLLDGVACSYDEHKKKRYITELKKFECPEVKFALEDRHIQVTFASATQISRLMIEKGENNELSFSLIKNLVEAPIDLNTATPQVSRVKTVLNKYNKPVIAILGGVRQITTPKDLLENTKFLLEHIIKKYKMIGVLTAGYKGMEDGVYGSTRGGYDACKFFLKETVRLVVMPNIKSNDHHTQVHALDLYGKTWGDDTPALIGAADAVVVFAPYGLVTELEIATALKQNKPVVIIEPEDYIHKPSGYLYPKAVQTFKSYLKAVEYLNKQLEDRQQFDDQEFPESIKNSLLNFETIGSPCNYDFTDHCWTNMSSGTFTRQLPSKITPTFPVNTIAKDSMKPPI